MGSYLAVAFTLLLSIFVFESDGKDNTLSPNLQNFSRKTSTITARTFSQGETMAIAFIPIGF